MKFENSSGIACIMLDQAKNFLDKRPAEIWEAITPEDDLDELSR